MMNRWLTFGLLVVLAIGCGDKKKGDADKDDEARPAKSGRTSSSGGDSSSAADPNAKPWDPALGTSTIQGTVKFTGKPPKRRPIDMAGRAECAMHAKDVLDESRIVAEDGGLKNAVVWVKSGLRAWKFTPPTTPAVLDQKGCRFEPHVLAVQVGQPVDIRNSDTFNHNVHSSSVLNSSFNFSQTGGKTDPMTFQRREMAIGIKCDIHGWMSTYVAVIDHPFFAVTDEKGKFEIKGLPKGDFVVESWHEAYKTKTENIKLGDKETKEVSFSYSP